MRYTHRFEVAAPIGAVAAFHREPSSLAAITPPPIRVRPRARPEGSARGDVVAFDLRIGPLAIPWRASIEPHGDAGFVDRMEEGPFRRWVHHHRFVDRGGSRTAVEDEIDFAFRPHPWWGPVGLGMAAGLPLLFAYRAWKTRRLVEASAGRSLEGWG